MQKITRDEFLQFRPDRAHDEKIHGAASVSLFWNEPDFVVCERQPDIGRVEWFVEKTKAREAAKL